MKKSEMINLIKKLEANDPLYISMSSALIDKFGEKPEGNPKYEVEYDGKIGQFRTLGECAKFAGKSQGCIFRILKGTNTYKKKTSDDIKNIRVTKLIN